MPSWEEIKEVLDSPYVSQEKKQALMEGYDKDTWNFNEEEERYASRYIDGYDDRIAAVPLSGDDISGPYEEAKAEMEEGQAKAGEAREKVEDSRNILEGMSPPSVEGEGVTTSGNILWHAKPTLDFLCQWIAAIWNKRPGGHKEKDYQEDIWTRFFENKNIHFQKFLGDADGLATAHNTLEESLSNGVTELNTLLTEWQGEGATAAKVKFEEAIQPNAQELLDHIEVAANIIPEVLSSIHEALKTKVDAALDLHRTEVAGATLEMASKVLRIARRETDDKDELLEVAGWIDSVCGSNLSSRLNNDGGCTNEENIEYAYEICEQWCWDSFTPEFQELLNSFDDICDTANDTIDKHWKTLEDTLTDYTNGFVSVSAGQGMPGLSPGSLANGPGGVGGIPGGGSGMPGGGGGTMPSGGVDLPSPTTDPEDVDQVEDGMNPVTGKPLKTDPETGDPYPIDPETGEEITDLEDGQNVVTVEKGANTFSISEPDAHGRMEISVADGQGTRGDYTLSFDTEDGNAGGDGEESGDGDPDDFGPQGTLSDDEQIYRPGPDGKIQIEDGDLKITAHQPGGPDGPTVVTLDDGDGEPTVYTLGEDEVGEDIESSAPERAASPAEDAREGTEQQSRDAGHRDESWDAGSDADSGSAEAVPPSEDEPSAEESRTADDEESGGDAGEETTPAAAGAGSGAGSPSEFGSWFGEPPLDTEAQASNASHPLVTEAGIGTAPGGTGETVSAGSQQGMGGGMPMMGGMGGGAGGGDGDQERGSNAYRILSDIFDIGEDVRRISGSLDSEENDSVLYQW